MKKTLLSVAALTFVFGTSVAMAQTTPAAGAEAAPTTSGKTVKPATKHHAHKHTKTAKKAA